MTEQDIIKAFEGRWRMKVESTSLPVGYVKGVKDLCFDFFQAAILICEQSVHDGSPVVITNDSFDAFWHLYDKKVGKDNCRKLWDKLSASEKQACIAYIEPYKQAQPDKQYRKNPETFLRNKSWNDELIYHNDTYNKPTIEQQRLSKLADILAGE